MSEAQDKVQTVEDVRKPALQWAKVLALVYLLMVAVALMSSGFEAATGDGAEELFAFATNPFAGLLVGTLATALTQSSSTVTSIVVGLVAGGLPVATAVPMVMGANIGTTITNTLVSLGHLGRGEEFKRAFAAATIHDFFNLISVLIFLPLEMTTHTLERLGRVFAHWTMGAESLSWYHFNPIQKVTSPVTHLFQTATHFLKAPFDSLVLICIGISLIFIAIWSIGKLLKILMVGRAEQILHGAIGRGSLAGMASGALVTAIVQSSSTTTSLVIPLAGTGLLRLDEIYPFTLGANIGTCVTALLAATAVGENSVAALEIATIHLLFNVLGVLLIYSTPWLKRLPLMGSTIISFVASRHQYLVFVYILTVFFLFPGLLLYLSTDRVILGF